MLDMPILKFEKSTKYLQKQLEIQRNNKQLVLDIITNIGLISKDSADAGKDYESALDSANLFYQTIISNISTIEQLDIEIKNITHDLTEIVSESTKPSKAKEFYITSFTNIKQSIVTYSKKIRELENKLAIDNRDFNDFINENNIKYVYKIKDSEGNVDTYEFSGFSLNKDEEDPNVVEEIKEISLVDEEPEESSVQTESVQETVENEIQPTEEIVQENNQENITDVNEEVFSESVSEEEPIAENQDMADLISSVIKESTQGINTNGCDYTSDINLETISSEFSIAPIDVESTDTESNAENENSSSNENNQDLTQELLNDISDDSDAMDSLLSSLITEEDLDNSNNEDSSKENTSEPSLMSALHVPIEEENLDNVEASDDETKPSYSEMFSNFYPSTQKENKVLTIDFSSLENSFKDFDKVLSEDYSSNSKPVFSDKLTSDEDTEVLDKEPIKPVETKQDVKEEARKIINSKSDTEISSDDISSLITDDDLLDLLSDEDVENSILSDDNLVVSDNSNDTDDIRLEESEISSNNAASEIDLEQITSLFDKQIARIEQGNYDNETLLISERTEKIYLPYKTTELLNYIHSYPNLYKSLGDVVKQEFVLPYTYFSEHPSKSRFSEAYNLIRNRECKNVISATAFAIRMAHKRNLNPAIIASCKSKAELDNYLYCLNSNKLDEFKEFKIAYEVNPI